MQRKYKNLNFDFACLLEIYFIKKHFEIWYYKFTEGQEGFLHVESNYVKQVSDEDEVVKGCKFIILLLFHLLQLRLTTQIYAHIFLSQQKVGLCHEKISAFMLSSVYSHFITNFKIFNIVENLCSVATKPIGINMNLTYILLKLHSFEDGPFLLNNYSM